MYFATPVSTSVRWTVYGTGRSRNTSSVGPSRVSPLRARHGSGARGNGWPDDSHYEGNTSPVDRLPLTCHWWSGKMCPVVCRRSTATENRQDVQVVSHISRDLHRLCPGKVVRVRDVSFTKALGSETRLETLPSFSEPLSITYLISV